LGADAFCRQYRPLRESRALLRRKQGPARPTAFIAIQGEAELIREKAEFEAHCITDLERWFENGVHTPGLVLIKFHATRINYWDGENEGDVEV